AGQTAGDRNGETGPGKGKAEGSQEKTEGEEKGKETEEQEKEGEKEKEPEPAWYSAHAQATLVTQKHDQFHSPYVGPHSLLPDEPAATSLTATLFLDARLWESDGNSGELVFNPEVAGGRGFSD